MIYTKLKMQAYVNAINGRKLLFAQCIIHITWLLFIKGIFEVKRTVEAIGKSDEEFVVLDGISNQTVYDFNAHKIYINSKMLTFAGKNAAIL